MAKRSPRSHERVREEILGQIESGRYPPGSRIPSIRELARTSGVSTLTVARAVRELAASGVLRPEHGRGCFVESVRPGAPTGAGTVTFMLSIPPDQALTQALFSRTLIPAQQALISAGYDVLLQRREPSAGDAAAPAGQTIIALGIYDGAALSQLARGARRVVVLDLDASGLGLDSVFLDDFAATGALVKALAARGARRIAFVGGPMPSREERVRAVYDPAALNRLNAWRGALAALGLDHGDDLVHATEWRDDESRDAAVRACLGAGGKVDAMLAEDAAGALVASAGPGAPLVAGWAMEPDIASDARLVACAVPDFEEMGREGAALVTEPAEPGTVRRVALPCPVRVSGV